VSAQQAAEMLETIGKRAKKFAERMVKDQGAGLRDLSLPAVCSQQCKRSSSPGGLRPPFFWSRYRSVSMMDGWEGWMEDDIQEWKDATFYVVVGSVVGFLIGLMF
jgi:hypothetical protein